jgi:hypothetical protein
MIATTHVIIGSALGSNIDAPWLALIAGMVSHYLLDSIPHLDYGHLCKKPIPFFTWASIIMDLTISLVLIILFMRTPHHAPNLVWGAIGAVLPDIIDNNPLWLHYTRRWPITRQHWQFHTLIHHKLEPRQQWLNVIIQVVIILIGLAYIPY